MLRAIFFFSLCIQFCSVASAQNLVKNPGFEEYYHLPDSAFIGTYYEDSVFLAKYWHRMWRSRSPNYFHAVSKDLDLSIPNNFLGNYPALEGNAYAGAFVLSLQNWSVLLSGEFIKPLEKGKEYEISFNYGFAHLKSYFLLDKIEAYVSPDNWITELHEPSPYYTENVEPYDTITRKFSQIIANVTFQTPIVNDGKWHKMTGHYKANGGEKYITLGIFYQNNEFSQAVHLYMPDISNLKPNRRKSRKFYRYYRDVLFIHKNPLYSPTPTDKELIKKGFEKRNQYAYYFFDNISVIEISHSDGKNNETKQK